MSKVTKMSIQGIRSFGPDDRDRGIIKFHTPLTLILGPNGTGKTTVIECLKYMTTGNQPPGTSAGSGRGAFIHDPKIAHEPTVNAQVKLQFYDVQQKLRTVTRSLKAVQKDKSGVQVSTLDSLLTFKDSTGEERSITSKCIDLNKEMASLMGVSKAVLENVIFCHQEDSSWPMSEGKVLKEKFDDIFASTRYVKAIDSIAKLRKDQASEVKNYQTSVDFLGKDKDKALNLQQTLQEKQSEYRGRQQLIEDITKKIEPIQAKLEAINEREADIWNLHNEKENVKFRKEQCVKTQEELLENIDNIFTGTLEDLELKMHEFQAKLKERENMLEKYERDVRSLERELEEFNDQKAKLLQDQGRLEQEQQQHKENIQNRDRLVQKLAGDYNIEGFSGRLSDEDADDFLKELGNQAKVVKDKAMKTRADFEEEEDALQKELDQVRRKKTALETELAMKKETMQTHQRKIREIGQKLKQMDTSAGRLEEVTENLKKAERELAALEKSVDLSALKKDVTKLQEEKLDLDTALKKLDAERDRLHSESSSRTQLEMWKKDKSTKTDQIRRLKNKNEESLTHLLGHVPADGGMHRALDDYLRTQKRQTQRDATALQELRMKLSSKETEKRSLTEKLAEKEREKKGYENEIAEVCDSQNFDKGLQSLQTKMQQSQENKGLLTGMLHLFNKYIDKLKKEDPPCPLCHRGFESEQEVNELKDELEGKLRQVPEKMEQYTSNFEESQRKYDRMQQLLPNKEKIADLDENTIPNLQAKLQSVKGQVAKLEEEITESQESLEMRQIDEATANSLLPDMNNIDRMHVEIRDLDRKIAGEQAKLSSSDGDRSIEVVNDDREDIKMRLESTGNELELKRARITEFTERVGHMRSEVNSLMAEKNEIDRDLQDRLKLEESRADLMATTTTLTSEVEEAEHALDPLHNQIQSLVQRKDKKTLQKEKQLEEDKDQLTKIKLSRNDVEKMQTDIRRYYQTGREKKLEKSKEEIQKIESDAVKVEDRKKTCISNVNKIRQDLDTQKIRERELSDNRQLLMKKQEAETLGEQLESLRERLKGIDVTKIARNKAEYHEELEKLTHSKSQYTGQQEQALQNIKEIERSLAAPDMKNAEAKYKDMKIKLRTTELANSDLEKYHKALDWTIMSYHKTKMAEINKIIRELWRNTYRGNDIDTIEIQSDEDKVTGSKRRTYNYRVVMVKGGAFLDMRGRCSAGQKVLASLIIRLALAETFCLNCGILALDEPTTNLDRENIESLAYALAEIIKSRQGQRNFQLIVITHDEDFVELLGRAEFVQKFTKVRKNQYGLSELVEANVADLHTR